MVFKDSFQPKPFCDYMILCCITSIQYLTPLLLFQPHSRFPLISLVIWFVPGLGALLVFFQNRLALKYDLKLVIRNQKWVRAQDYLSLIFFFHSLFFFFLLANTPVQISVFGI